MILEGVYRRFFPFKSGKGDIAVRLTQQESVAVAQVEPACMEMSRAGRRFVLGNNAAITGIAPVQVLPTTAAQWVIFNNDPTRTYFFEEVGMYLTSGTPGVGGTLLTCIFQSPSQNGIAATVGTSITSLSNGSMSSKAIVKSSVTITTPTAPNWYPIASNASPNVTAFASSTFLEHRNVQGALAVQPGQGLGLAVVSPAGTTPLFAPFARWIEIEADME